MQSLLKKNFLLFAIAIVSVFYFKNLVFYNFATDDFFYLWIGKYENLKEFLYFFTFEHSFKSGYIFYRPLTTQAYFAIYQNLFGINAFPFHITSIALHVANIFLIYKLARLLFTGNNRLFPALSAMFYGLNPSHTLTIAWAGNTQEIAATSFIILSSYFFYQNLKEEKKVFLFLSVIFFIGALLTKEVAMVLPAAQIALIIFFGKVKNLMKIIPFLPILAYYVFMHFIKYNFQQTETYTFQVNLQAINTLRWHLWWALGFPEPFINFIGPKLSILPSLWVSFLKEATIVFSLFAILNLTLIYAILKTATRKIKELLDKRIIYFILFYLIFLLPVLFLPQNKYAFHQSTALVGFSIATSLILEKFYKQKFKYARSIITAIVISFVVLSYVSVDITTKNNFVLLRSRIADKVLNPFLEKYPTLPEGTVIYIKNDPNYLASRVKEWGGSAKQASYALNNDLAFKVYYDKNIKVYYEGIEEPPQDIDKTKLIEYVADLNLDKP